MSNINKTGTRGKVAIVIAIELIMTALFGMSLNVVSPMITSINAQTGWSLGRIAQFNATVFFLMGACGFIGSPLMDKFGTKKTAVIALTLATIGNLISFAGKDVYAVHMIGRVLYGCGWGIFFVVPGCVINYWLPPEKRAVVLGVRCACDIGSGGIAFYIIMPIFRALGENWQYTIGTFGIFFALLLAAYIFCVQLNDAEKQEMEQKRLEKEKQKAEGKFVVCSGLRKAAKSKQVWILTLSHVGSLWIYNSFLTYLPTFFETQRGYSPDVASRITGVMCICAIVSGLVGGTVSNKMGRRKVLVCPTLAMMVLGAMCCLFVKNIVLACIFSGLIGFGFAAFMTAYTLIPGELPGADNEFYTGAVAIIYGIAFMVTYFISYPFDFLLQKGLSMNMVLFIFTIPGVIALIASFFVAETGPKGKKALKE